MVTSHMIKVCLIKELEGLSRISTSSGQLIVPKLCLCMAPVRRLPPSRKLSRLIL
jgi:hypothetical protein